MDKLSPRQAAIRMRELPESERNAAIDNSANVSDLRATLNARRKNRLMADFYRRAFSNRPPDGAA